MPVLRDPGLVSSLQTTRLMDERWVRVTEKRCEIGILGALSVADAKRREEVALTIVLGFRRSGRGTFRGHVNRRCLPRNQ